MVEMHMDGYTLYLLWSEAIVLERTCQPQENTFHLYI
jgi:hypothetical protein